MNKYYLIILIAIISVFYAGCGKDEELEESNEIPIANFSANPRSGPAPLTVTFTDHSENIPTTWLWTLGDNSTSTAQNPTRTYHNIGTYSVTLSVTNGIGSDTKINTNFIVVTASNTHPEALFTVFPYSGTIKTVFAFDASVSSDDYDPISNLQVRWDFDGNGSWDTDWETNKTQNHQYSNANTYTAKLEVKDTQGLISQYTKSITVSVNTRPNALYTVSPTDGRLTTIFVFSALSSTDDDLISNLQARWDFDGSGTWDTNWDTIKIQTHQYSNVGNYEAKLEVKDVEGLTDQYTKSILVNANAHPTAMFTVNPSSGTINTAFVFNASSSTDDYDHISNLQARWDFDGNGTWDTDWNIDKTQNHLYINDGNYTAKLEIKDTEGLTDQYTKSIIVSIGCGAQANLTYGGQTYEIVEIGSQCWMAENLNYETSNSWWYENSSANGNIYGRLYTWEAALNVCPSGWHLPSDEEWKTMEMALGMSQSEADEEGFRGTDEGKKMKSTSGWEDGGNGTNSSGFNALPGGYRLSNGSFDGLGGDGFWWSSTDEYSSWKAWYRRLLYDNDQVIRYNYRKTRGRSVRCIKD